MFDVKQKWEQNKTQAGVMIPATTHYHTTKVPWTYTLHKLYGVVYTYTHTQTLQYDLVSVTRTTALCLYVCGYKQEPEPKARQGDSRQCPLVRREKFFFIP